MGKTDDVDLMLILNPHGWGTCLFFIESKITIVDLTLTFGNPFIDLIQSLENIINNQNETEFYWFGEPGGNRIRINKIINQQNKVNVSIEEFDEEFGEKIEDYETKVSFEIKTKHLLILFYNQLKKTEMLMKGTEYASKRKNDFPFDEFKKFETNYTEYINRKC